MTTPSSAESNSISIQIEDPLVWSERTLSLRLSEQVENYIHNIRAIGGYYSANIRINDNQYGVESWLSSGQGNGLGRHITTYNPELEVIWEGFVNKISVSLGGLSYSFGPLMNISNRASAIYSPLDTSTDPPVRGERTKTAVANDTDSQGLYGIIESIISKGGKTSTEATQARDIWIAKRANPEKSTRDNVTGQSGPSVNLECLGYWHWLNLYVYNNTSTTGDINLSQKIQDVLGAELNSLFSTDYSKIETNTLQVPDYDNKDRKAIAVLKELNSLGDSSDNRYNIGCYAGRQFVYEQAPDEYEYQRRITGNKGIENNLGAMINPWDVLPGKWIFYPDFLVGQQPPLTSSTLRTDLRTTYIESAKFTAPWSVSISGEKIGEIDQVMAKLGFKGEGS